MYAGFVVAFPLTYCTALRKNTHFSYPYRTSHLISSHLNFLSRPLSPRCLTRCSAPAPQTPTVTVNAYNDRTYTFPLPIYPRHTIPIITKFTQHPISCANTWIMVKVHKPLRPKSNYDAAASKRADRTLAGLRSAPRQEIVYDTTQRTSRPNHPRSTTQDAGLELKVPASQTKHDPTESTQISATRSRPSRPCTSDNQPTSRPAAPPRPTAQAPSCSRRRSRESYTRYPYPRKTHARAPAPSLDYASARAGTDGGRPETVSRREQSRARRDRRRPWWCGAVSGERTRRRRGRRWTWRSGRG